MLASTAMPEILSMKQKKRKNLMKLRKAVVKVATVLRNNARKIRLRRWLPASVSILKMPMKAKTMMMTILLTILKKAFNDVTTCSTSV